MEQGYIIAYNSRFTNNNPHTVIDKETATNRRTWMDFNRPLHDENGEPHDEPRWATPPYINGGQRNARTEP